MNIDLTHKTYQRSEVCPFRKTKERFGGLSNMAAGFPITINGIDIRTSEALYQACRYPLRIDVQENIIKQKSPMTAKMVMKPFKEFGRPDWQEVKFDVMFWCIKVKLAQNYKSFGAVLDSTGEKPIVEDSARDFFWGAKPNNNDQLIGYNVMGQLLMKLRDLYYSHDHEYFSTIQPLSISDFLLFGKRIDIVTA
jgi:ribA/ribD-fused uncharacterized protein